MQKEILKTLGENPRVAKELSIYLRGIGIDLNKFVLEDSLPNKLYHFINFFTNLYDITIEIGHDITILRKHNEYIKHLSLYSNHHSYEEFIEKSIVETIIYCEKPF